MALVVPSGDPALAAEQRTLDLVVRDGEPLVLVDSPPGAGKSSLAETVVATAVHLGLRVALVAPTNEQTYALAMRLIANWTPMPIQMLMSARNALPRDLAAARRVAVANNVQGLQGGPGVVISTVSKFKFSADDLAHAGFHLLICDEAYQVAFRDLYPLFLVASQVLLIGDPGQLPPIVQADIARYEAARFKVHWAAPRELQRRFANAPVVQLPLSRRLRQDTVDLVQPAFYPQLPFASAAADAERRIVLPVAGFGNPVDAALDRLADGASVVVLVLPARTGPEDEVDDEVSALMARVAARAIARGAQWPARVARPILDVTDIGCVDPHVRSGARLRRELRRLGVGDVVTDTVERWQGLERALMVVKHPLSGTGILSAFALEPGRWCVMLSRHQLGCVIVTRDGIGDGLEAHAHDASARASGAQNLEWLGWSAHSSLWNGLRDRARLLPVA